jgi:hypothetical protein
MILRYTDFRLFNFSFGASRHEKGKSISENSKKDTPFEIFSALRAFFFASIVDFFAALILSSYRFAL